jgi:hypothetical protein
MKTVHEFLLPDVVLDPERSTAEEHKRCQPSQRLSLLVFFLPRGKFQEIFRVRLCFEVAIVSDETVVILTPVT